MALHCAEPNSYSQLLDLLQLGCGKRCFPGGLGPLGLPSPGLLSRPRAAPVPGKKGSGGKPAPRYSQWHPCPPWARGEGRERPPSAIRLDFTDGGAGNLDAPAPGLTQSSPSRASATNHVGVGPGSLLGRQTAKAKPPRFSASTARSVSTATARGGWGGLVRSEKRSEENRCFGFLVPAPPPPQDWQFLSGRDPGIVLLPFY